MKDEKRFQYVYVSFLSLFAIDTRPPPSGSLTPLIGHLVVQQINLQENPLKSFLVSMFISSLRKTVPVEQHPTYLLSHQSLEYLREPLGMPNKHVGYVFLVDWIKKIRWAGCSWATVDEEEALRKCSHVLVERLKVIEREQ